jgi:molybdate transport system ATP-binding protein
LARRLTRRSRPRLRSIELDGVSVRRGGRWALRNVSLVVNAGERWLLTGRNGSGKTMLLKLLRGDVWPTPSGRQRRIYELDREKHAQPLAARERIAYLGPEAQDKFERYEWNLRVIDVVATGYTDSDLPLERPTRAQLAGALRALRSVRLAGLARRRFLTLSNGQRRRVLLARALVRGPDVLLLDEALNGLDARSRRAFLATLERVSSRTAWMLSTHRLSDAPRSVTHRARLDGGRLLEVRTHEADHGRRAPDSRRDGIRATARPAASLDPNPLVQLFGVSVYRDYREVLHRLDWTLARGEHWSITGANGSGKSTLIALLYGDLPAAYGGRIERAGLLHGQPIELWKARVGLVSPELQATCAATRCTVLELIVSGLHSSIGLNQPVTSGEAALARRVAGTLGLRSLLGRSPRELSYGQLRAALFARAFARPRELWLLHAPFLGIDADGRGVGEQRLRDAIRRGAQVVVATHHREDVPGYVTRELALDGTSLPRRRRASGVASEATSRR